MPISIANPRAITTVLGDYGSKEGVYKFVGRMEAFLASQGWELVKKTKDYVHFRPPVGVTKPFRFKLLVPTKEQIEQLAAERHAEGTVWGTMLGEWPAVYYPSRGITSQEVDLFTGENIGVPQESGSIPAMFSVGHLMFWQAMVTFAESGTSYQETPVEQPFPTSQQSLFDATEDDDPVEVKPNPVSIASEPPLTPEPDEEEFPEGRVLFRLHRLRERDPAIIELAKKAAKAKTGRLACCVCNFDFGAVYGPLGEDYIEGHHNKPVSELEEGATTKVSDISLVCANCHRMLHRKRPWLGVNELQSLLMKKQSTD